MSDNPLIIDLCCGIGRFEGDNVVSIDSNIKAKPTICADIRYLPLRKGLQPDHVHASPPCTYFSISRRSEPWNFDGIGESLELVAACFRAFHYLQAKKWTLENPVGYLGKILNQKRINYKNPHPKYKFKPTHFWSSKDGMKRAIITQDVRQRILS